MGLLVIIHCKIEQIMPKKDITPLQSHDSRSIEATERLDLVDGGRG